MLERKLNCWEYMKCDRQHGGSNASDLCPAAYDASFDGINQGKNAGRICWAVAGTFCGGRVQGTFAEKRGSCINCEFFKRVQEEQGSSDLAMKFLDLLSEDKRSHLLSRMTYKTVKAGQRFLNQGEMGVCAYIIQRGSCLVIVEKDGELHPVGHRGRGDIVGEMAILTGEPRPAHADAETDMELWVLHRAVFDDISRDDPGMLEFLTELVATRLDSKRPIADRIIGKYIATDIIGRGGYSVVYKGVHSGLGMPVAIKMMRHHLALDPDFQKGFLNEAKTIANLNHENIVRVYDIEERFRTLFIIEEYVEGESLRDLIARLKSLAPPVAANFLMQICSGLGYAHRQGIIHRDINPTNLFVQPEDRLKILDFGLACPIGTEDLEYGTLAYMAPEQVEGDPVDQRTDIYALGVTAYEMVTGKKPFPERDLRASIEMHLQKDVPDPAEEVKDLPEPLRRFIMKAARRDPRERYQDAAEALKEIQSLANEFTPARKKLPMEKHRMSTLFLMYSDEQQLALNRLMAEFSARVQELGVQMKMADLSDI